VVVLAVDRQPAALLGIADPIRPTAAAALAALAAEGIQIHMLTGDDAITAAQVGKQLGLAKFSANLFPADKLNYVEQLIRDGRVVAMAGDGVNDAPALARAHVGIALGTGTGVAMETAAITLVRGDLQGIVSARRLSRAVLTNIRQNLFLAFAYNLLCIPVAAGVLYPLTGLLLSPMLAAAAMTLSSLSVIANALRLRRVPL
jgi:Cu+-exporting ATPase